MLDKNANNTLPAKAASINRLIDYSFGGGVINRVPQLFAIPRSPPRTKAKFSEMAQQLDQIQRISEKLDQI